MSIDISSPETIAALAEIERRMDAGAQPFVIVGGGERMAFDADLLAEYGVHSGQTVTHHIALTLMGANLARLNVQIAIDKAKGAKK